MKIQQLKDNISIILRNKGLTARALEIKAGLSQSYVNNLLLGRSKNPSLDAIIKIAEALGITVDELLGNAHDHKDYDLDIERQDIFLKSAYHLLQAIEKKPNVKFNVNKLFDALLEIYTFSLKDGKFDKEFADWFIKSRLL